ncbi:MAG TPA: plastocyanin/azurin family copper-binding protein [Candidatus Eisenbacteria bacterium]|nr:plastocyanin/azurin family copper-binding protein [Candidatus Eisenbacteria bacterium]
MKAPFRVFRLLAVPVLILATATSCNSGKSNPTGPGTAGPELDSGVLGPGAVYQHTFASAGSYAYHCIFHTPMRGTVQVNAAAADSIAHVSITSSTTTFPGATIRPGGSVVWTNNTQLDHTVTSD